MIDYLGAYQEEFQRLNYKQKCSGIRITLQGTYYYKPIDGPRIRLLHDLFYWHLEPDRHAPKPVFPLVLKS
jgi:hypothetical protein